MFALQCAHGAASLLRRLDRRRLPSLSLSLYPSCAPLPAPPSSSHSALHDVVYARFPPAAPASPKMAPRARPRARGDTVRRDSRASAVLLVRAWRSLGLGPRAMRSALMARGSSFPPLSRASWRGRGGCAFYTQFMFIRLYIYTHTSSAHTHTVCSSAVDIGRLVFLTPFFEAVLFVSLAVHVACRKHYATSHTLHKQVYFHPRGGVPRAANSPPLFVCSSGRARV